MTKLETLPEATAPVISAMETEPLFDIQLRVARRADVLARRQFRASREVDRRVWLRAELEIFDQNDRRHA